MQQHVWHSSEGMQDDKGLCGMNYAEVQSSSKVQHELQGSCTIQNRCKAQSCHPAGLAAQHSLSQTTLQGDIATSASPCEGSQVLGRYWENFLHIWVGAGEDSSNHGSNCPRVIWQVTHGRAGVLTKVGQKLW